MITGKQILTKHSKGSYSQNEWFKGGTKLVSVKNKSKNGVKKNSVPDTYRTLLQATMLAVFHRWWQKPSCMTHWDNWHQTVSNSQGVMMLKK